MQTNSQIQAQAAALRALMDRAWTKRYCGPDGARRERPAMVDLFHTIGNAEDNANDSAREQGFAPMGTDEGDRQWNEAFLASLYTDNVIVRKILAKFGFRF
jgi:hypothetical protein